MRLFVTICFVLFIADLIGQDWKIVNEEGIDPIGIKDIQPNTYTLYSINDEDIKKILWSSPDESVGVKNSKTTLPVGLPNGEMDTFKIVRYSMMESPLADSFPDIRTFYGVSITIKGRRIRIDYTDQGFRAVISTPDSDKIFIDHYQRGDKNHRVVYFKKDYKKTPSWGCKVDDSFIKEESKNKESASRVGDCLFRSYRLALAATGEFSNFHGATNATQSSIVLSAVTTGVNRLNEVYESEIAVRLVLVGNTTQIFFYNPSTDPYTATNASAMLGENQTTCTNVIGTANFDIGHVFGALGNNGVAGLGVICSTNNKARGVTTSTQPVNDPFYIDYVAHEMGHQFNGNHTQNNNCNRNGPTAMEPGSASSIMGYAGICSPNVQSNSDAYFHAINLQEIKTFLQSGNGSNCDNFIPNYSNTPPVVTTQPNYIIPRSTPFVLTLSASDPDGDLIQYAWDQMNNQTATMPPVSTSTSGPAFRSIYYTSNPSRYFPNIATVLTGNTANTWEVVPSVGRNLNFRGIARDITGSGNASCNSEINVVVTTVAAAGPFVITSHNTNTTWTEGQNVAVTWNVAGTTANGINCANVDIFMSFDGGQTYPEVLATSIPNTGSYNIVVPNNPTTTGRYMIKGSGNIFFDVNNANITITPGLPGFNLSRSPDGQTTCPGQSKSFTIEVLPVLGFSNPVTLSVPGLPLGYSASFSSNPVIPGNTSVLTITNISAPIGTINQVIQGVSGSINRQVTVALTSSNGSLNASPALSTPVNQSTSVSILPTLVWNPVVGATSYDLELSRSQDFYIIEANVNDITGTSYLFSQYLEGASEYFWRVRAKNDCITGNWSSVFTFYTEACFVYQANDVPLIISSNGTPTIHSYQQITDRGIMTDLDVLELKGLHSYVSDLRFTLFSPVNTNVVFWDQPCAEHDNFDINFNQSAPLGSWPCPPTDGGTYRPSNSLNIFNGASINGVWDLRVEDLFNDDGGSLESWALKTCVTDFCRLIVDNTFSRGAGSLYEAVQCARAGDTIKFASHLDNDTIRLFDVNLTIFEQIYIECEISRNIHVTSTSSSSLITNNTFGNGDGLRIKGLHLHGTVNNNSVMDNRGVLVLEDVIMYRNNVGAEATILNRNGSAVQVIGECEERE